MVGIIEVLQELFFSGLANYRDVIEYHHLSNMPV